MASPSRPIDKAASGCARTSGSPSLFGFLRSACALVRLWRLRVRERRMLARFSERDMRDLGLTRMDIVRECEKPFWRK